MVDGDGRACPTWGSILHNPVVLIERGASVWYRIRRYRRNSTLNRRRERYFKWSAYLSGIDTPSLRSLLRWRKGTRVWGRMHMACKSKRPLSCPGVFFFFGMLGCIFKAAWGHIGLLSHRGKGLTLQITELTSVSLYANSDTLYC